MKSVFLGLLPEENHTQRAQRVNSAMNINQHVPGRMKGFI